jgi:hypothetical protein
VDKATSTRELPVDKETSTTRIQGTSFKRDTKHQFYKRTPVDKVTSTRRQIVLQENTRLTNQKSKNSYKSYVYPNSHSNENM